MSGKINKQLFQAHEHALDHESCPQCSGELAMHIFDVMQGVLDSAQNNQFVDIDSCCDTPLALPETFP